MLNTVADNPIVNPDAIDEDYVHVVAAVVWNQNNRHQFLIAQRQKGKHLEDYWELPGGKLESGESPWQALQRELNEEINILAISASPFMQVYYRYPDRNILLDTWTVDAYRGEVKSVEQQLLRWIDIMQTGSYRFPAADIPIIDAIKSNATAETLHFP